MSAKPLCAVNVPYASSRYAPKWPFLIPDASASVRALVDGKILIYKEKMQTPPRFESLTTNQKAGSSNLSGRAIFFNNLPTNKPARKHLSWYQKRPLWRIVTRSARHTYGT